ncbi:hypothetical protein [Lignipirellula cremea]|uniref:Uncharacterized protein n=1 Tax=Lignipirellula cremea TaxID=2528010 RepID=A0A518DV36_9BACT|nr:hypothetical protein [Lignipirellula cremea]QDU95687.1 hypothetical protein Pla8534_35040 [Lignipirellula cremea]
MLIRFCGGAVFLTIQFVLSCTRVDLHPYFAIALALILYTAASASAGKYTEVSFRDIPWILSYTTLLVPVVVLIRPATDYLLADFGLSDMEWPNFFLLIFSLFVVPMELGKNNFGSQE